MVGHDDTDVVICLYHSLCTENNAAYALLERTTALMNVDRHTDTSDLASSEPVAAHQSVVTAVHNMDVVDGEHRTMADLPAIRQESNLPSMLIQIPAGIRMAGDIAYTVIGAIIVLLVLAAVGVSLSWFFFDIGNIHPAHMASVDVRNQVITAVADLLSNVALILVLVEVLTALVTFIRTRRASARPILLIALFVLMRAIIKQVDQVVTSPLQPNNQIFVKTLAEMGALALVGLFISVALAVIRDPNATSKSKATSASKEE